MQKQRGIPKITYQYQYELKSECRGFVSSRVDGSHFEQGLRKRSHS